MTFAYKHPLRLLPKSPHNRVVTFHNQICYVTAKNKEPDRRTQLRIRPAIKNDSTEDTGPENFKKSSGLLHIFCLSPRLVHATKS
jgi:hypothetical protein